MSLRVRSGSPTELARFARDPRVSVLVASPVAVLAPSVTHGLWWGPVLFFMTVGGLVGAAMQQLRARLTEERAQRRELVRLHARTLVTFASLVAHRDQPTANHCERVAENARNLGRLLAVVDVFEAMTAPRPYRAALPPPDVMEHLREHAGRYFDPGIVRRFEQLHRRGWVRTHADGCPTPNDLSLDIFTTGFWRHQGRWVAEPEPEGELVGAD